MSPISVRTLGDTPTLLSSDTLAELAAELEGDLLTSEHPAYDEERTLWNGMIDRRPALAARCRSADDVVRCVRFAREHDLEICVRGAGHNIAGRAVTDDAFLISLLHMRRVEVDPASRSVRVQAGATLGDVDAAAQKHGLALPVGINSTTGIAGLTLGGGFGWITRKHGLTIDSLLGADVVLASGEYVRANPDENPDLFWAIRGGGGNFGIVTSFHFRLHPVGPEVLAGLIVHPFEHAEEVLRFHRDFAETLPDETTVFAVLRKAPPLPFLPEEWHGREVVILAVCHSGDMKEGEELLQPLRDFGEPIADVVGPHSFAEWQQAFDPLLTPGARNYWKSHDFREISDEMISVAIRYAGELPTPQCEIFLAQLGGAMGRVADSATAYANRSTRHVLNVHTRWNDAEDDARCIAWAREFFDAAAPHATGSVYVNFMPDDEVDRVRQAYGGNFERLQEIKEKFDPENVLRMNQNIQPRAMA